LLGLYTAERGTIRVDGVDLAALPIEEWRSRCAAAFQDYCRFELSAREAVGVGDVERVSDDGAVLAALDRAGAPDFAGALPRGLDTSLGTAWGGVDLSAGQWQTLALARAMMRDAPLLLVLDEPTSSLDADAEHSLFKRYATMLRERGTAGTVTVLVSHRFSTVRNADLIVVFKDGRVVEQGDHAELLASRGLYAEMYAIQAQGYR
jgi:ATP-binding cassette subfamily B protein